MNAPDSPNSRTLLGPRVRSLRAQRQWTLETASRFTGLARSTLSKIENGQMSPTYDGLIKLARGFAIDIKSLFAPPPPEGSGRRSITRAGQGQPLDVSNYRHALLCGDLSHKRMTPFHSVVLARRFEDFSDWSRHEGEELVFVLKGRVQMFTEFYEPVQLKPGDCAYLDSRMGHHLISISKDDAHVLWVTTNESAMASAID